MQKTNVERLKALSAYFEKIGIEIMPVSDGNERPTIAFRSYDDLANFHDYARQQGKEIFDSVTEKVFVHIAHVLEEKDDVIVPLIYGSFSKKDFKVIETLMDSGLN